MITDLQTILDAGKVIPVLAYNSIGEALKTSRTLYDAGIRVFEITLRHPTALEALHTPLAPSGPAPPAGDQVRAGEESGGGG
jgi:2-dehydro-3-deoxyphosphogluconate aldolase/(4S)-4-hydroxy-2-oxoglutarate aldolase